MAALTAPSGCCACGKCSNVGRSLHSSKSAANAPLVHGQVRTRTEVQSWRPPLYIRAAGHGVLSFLISNRWPCHRMHCTLLLTMPQPSQRRLKTEISVVSLRLPCGDHCSLQLGTGLPQTSCVHFKHTPDSLFRAADISGAKIQVQPLHFNLDLFPAFPLGSISNFNYIHHNA